MRLGVIGCTASYYDELLVASSAAARSLNLASRVLAASPRLLQLSASSRPVTHCTTSTTTPFTAGPG